MWWREWRWWLVIVPVALAAACVPVAVVSVLT